MKITRLDSGIRVEFSDTDQKLLFILKLMLVLILVGAIIAVVLYGGLKGFTFLDQQSDCKDLPTGVYPEFQAVYQTDSGTPIFVAISKQNVWLHSEIPEAGSWRLWPIYTLEIDDGVYRAKTTADEKADHDRLEVVASTETLQVYSGNGELQSQVAFSHKCVI